MNQNEHLAKIYHEINSFEGFSTLSSEDRLIILCNLILSSIKDHLPRELQSYSAALLDNGKELNLKMMQYKNNMALKIALKAHLILDLSKRLV